MQPNGTPASKPVLTYQIGDRLYLNITDRCTLRCRFRPKDRNGPQVHQFDLGLEVRPAVADVISAIDGPTAYREVIFCGFGEPTLRLKPLLEIAKYIKAKGDVSVSIPTAWQTGRINATCYRSWEDTLTACQYR
jgi:TatD family-associated radical SAM protein